MKAKRYYAGEALKWLCGMMGTVSKNVFAVHRPTACGTQMSDLVVVSFVNEIDDNGAYQSADIRIDLMARDKGQNIANVERLQEMCDSLMDIFPLSEGRFNVLNPRLIIKGSDSEGFSVWIMYASLLINTSDRLEV